MPYLLIFYRVCKMRSGFSSPLYLEFNYFFSISTIDCYHPVQRYHLLLHDDCSSHIFGHCFHRGLLHLFVTQSQIMLLKCHSSTLPRPSVLISFNKSPSVYHDLQCPTTQQPHHLKVCQKCKFSGPTPDLLKHKNSGSRAQKSVLASSSDDGDKD